MVHAIVWMGSVPHSCIWTGCCCCWRLGKLWSLGTLYDLSIEVSHHGWPLKVPSASSSIPNDMALRIKCVLCATEYQWFSMSLEFGSALAEIIYILVCTLLLVLLTLVTMNIFPTINFSSFNFCFIYFASMLLNSSKLSFVMSSWIDLSPSIEKCFSLPPAMEIHPESSSWTLWLNVSIVCIFHSFIFNLLIFIVFCN